MNGIHGVSAANCFKVDSDVAPRIINRPTNPNAYSVLLVKYAGTTGNKADRNLATPAIYEVRSVNGPRTDEYMR